MNIKVMSYETRKERSLLENGVCYIEVHCFTGWRDYPSQSTPGGPNVGCLFEVLLAGS
jgi:hypothetical protein